MNKSLKDSGVEWIGEIPNGWQVLKFKYIMKKDKVIAKKYNNEDVISLTKSGVIIRDLENPTGKMPASFDGYQHVEEGDLLLCLFDIDVTPRCVGIVRNNGVTSPAYSRYRLLEGFDLNYYNYLLTYLDDEKILLSYTKSLRNTLTDEYFGAVSTIRPSLEEQQKIAAFLDEKVAHIDNIIEDTKKSIENLMAYKQSLITETVTKGLNPDVEMKDSGIDWIGAIPQHWINSRIKYVTRISRGQFSHRPRNDERFYNGEYPFIQTGDVARAGKYITTYSQTLNELGKKVSKEFPQGTLVMNIAANVGDVAILDFDSYFPDSVVGFVPIEDYHWNYLYYIFSGMKPTFVRTAISNTQLNLNIDRIKDMYIPVTLDYSEQVRIADFLDNKISNIDSLIKKKSKIIKELESYKKSLIYEYVTGKKEVK